MALTITVGSEQSNILIPVADGVLTKCITVQENKWNASRVDYGFKIIDFDYENDDQDTEDEIRALAEREFVHWESCNVVLNEEGELGKRTKLYKLLRGMKGGKDIEKGEEIDLQDAEENNFRIDFDHEEKKGPPPDYNVIPGVMKAFVAKIRPERKERKTRQAPLSTDPDEALFDQEV